jgi:ribosomal protein S18 acetylase RimI-like enzyme
MQNRNSDSLKRLRSSTVHGGEDVTEVREPELSDSQDLDELTGKSWKQGFKSFLNDEEVFLAQEVDSFFRKESFERDKADDRLVYLVAEVDGKVVAQVRIAWADETTHEFVDVEQGEAELRSVYVHPIHWREGIGTRLVRESLQKLPDNIDEVKVEAIKQNRKSVNFYKKLGFEKFEEGELDSSEPDLLTENRETVRMKKSL